MPLNHVSLVSGRHFASMSSFYPSSLVALGYVMYFDKADFMLGLKPVAGIPDFWLHAGKDAGADPGPGRTHVAFDSESREVVDRWYEAAV
ncbi:hypothetical protein F5Y16DRAFT_370463 [Xylariaceae sp. FL0255]|nr:hypothetical protein F5Y16DRAFT_370463 [Xylariaceae sp. FL0255]